MEAGQAGAGVGNRIAQLFLNRRAADPAASSHHAATNA
jgi:hypothetical protein